MISQECRQSRFRKILQFCSAQSGKRGITQMCNVFWSFLFCLASYYRIGSGFRFMTFHIIWEVDVNTKWSVDFKLSAQPRPLLLRDEGYVVVVVLCWRSGLSGLAGGSGTFGCFLFLAECVVARWFLDVRFMLFFAQLPLWT